MSPNLQETADLVTSNLRKIPFSVATSQVLALYKDITVHSFFYKSQKNWLKAECSYFSKVIQPQNVFLLLLFEFFFVYRFLKILTIYWIFLGVELC